MTNKTLRAILHASLIEAGMSKLELAERTGIPYSTISKRFREPETMPIEELMRISRVLRMPVQIGGGNAYTR